MEDLEGGAEVPVPSTWPRVKVFVVVVVVVAVVEIVLTVCMAKLVR